MSDTTTASTTAAVGERVREAFRLDAHPLPKQIFPAQLPALEHQATLQVRAEIESLLLAGEVVPEDVAQPIVDARHKAELAALRMQSINAARETLQSDRAESKRAHAAAGFAQIGRELERIFEEARALSKPLRGAADADAAIALGVTSEWRRLTELSVEYGEMRRLQIEHTNDLSHDIKTTRQRELYRVGFFRNSLDIHPYWIAARVNAFNQSTEPPASDDRVGDSRYYAWLAVMAGRAISTDPSDQWSRSFWPTHDSKQGFLLWLADHAEPWAPMPNVVEALADQARIAIQPLRQRNGFMIPSTALAEFARLAGTKSPLHSKH